MNIKKLVPIVGIIILILLLSTLNFKEIINIILKINPLYSFICFFAPAPIILLAIIEWQILLKKQKINVKYWYSLKNCFIGYFYGFITPGGIGAYTRSIYLSNESKAPLPKCLSNIIIFNTIDYIALLLAGLVGAIALSSVFPYLFYSIVMAIFVVLILFLFFFKNKRSKIVFTRIIRSKVFDTLRERLEDSIDTFYEDLPSFKDILLPFALSFFGWFLRFLEFYLISKLFGINVPILYFVLIAAIADVIATIPISVYGLGTRELALVSLFSASKFSVASEAVVSLSLFWFFVNSVPPSIIGAFVTYFETKKMDDFVLKKETIDRFASYMKKYPHLYDYVADLVKKNLSKKASKPVIVDLGVGPGLLSKSIVEKMPDAKIVGIDPLDKMLKLAEENVKSKNFEARKGLSEKIPLDDNCADVVVSRFSLTYWQKPLDSFAEIYRVLKPGGRVVLEVLNKDFPKSKLYAIKVNMRLKGAESDVIRYHMDAYKTAYTIESVSKIFQKTNFKVIYKESGKKDWKFVIIGEK